jgi:hypothetical protein
MPLTEYSELPKLSDETVTGLVLVESVSVWLWLEPTVTFPKLTEDGVTLKTPAAVPTPFSAIDICAPADETSSKFPKKSPMLVGENVTWKVKLGPGASVRGVLIPPVVKGLDNAPPEVEIWLIVREELLGLVTVSVRVYDAPIPTRPNPRLGGFAVSVRAATPVPLTDNARLEFDALL